MVKNRLKFTVALLGVIGAFMFLKSEYIAGAILLSSSGLLDGVISQRRHSK